VVDPQVLAIGPPVCWPVRATPYLVPEANPPPMGVPVEVEANGESLLAGNRESGDKVSKLFECQWRVPSNSSPLSTLFLDDQDVNPLP